MTIVADDNRKKDKNKGKWTFTLAEHSLGNTHTSEKTNQPRRQPGFPTDGFTFFTARRATTGTLLLRKR